MRIANKPVPTVDHAVSFSNAKAFLERGEFDFSFDHIRDAAMCEFTKVKLTQAAKAAPQEWLRFPIWRDKSLPSCRQRLPNVEEARPRIVCEVLQPFAEIANRELARACCAREFIPRDWRRYAGARARPR